eukprot:symbB.v1.2.024478.t3/scaffold2322.1/size82342/6
MLFEWIESKDETSTERGRCTRTPGNIQIEQRIVLPDWLVERVLFLVEWLLAMAISIPMMLVSVLSFTILLARITDLLGNFKTTEYVRQAVFGHVADPCDQPIGVMLILFWCIAFLRVTLIYMWLNCIENGCFPSLSCLETRTCRSLRFILCWCTLIVTVIFELTWPPATLVMLLVARNCTWRLRGSAWLVLCPYLAQMLSVIFWLIWPCVRPVFRRTGLISNPSLLVNSFPAVAYDAEVFNDVGYASTCAICLSDFTDTADGTIVLAPCGQGHVFHRSCLAEWFQSSQTCPLCRRHLTEPGSSLGAVEMTTR